MSGATVNGGAQCIFTVTVTGVVAGNYTNTTSAVTSTNGGTGNVSSANLSVVIPTPPSLATSFIPSAISPGSTTGLQFTITNPNASSVALTGVGFTDTLPAGLTVPNASATVCGGTVTLTAPSGISMSGATVNGGAQCIFTVTVTGVVAGNYTNTTSAISSTNGGTGNVSSANLSVGIVVISPTSLPNGTVGAPYSQLISASGGTAPYTFTVTSGTLPPGLGLGASGALSGPPTAAGTFNFTVTAKDTNGLTVSQSYAVVISSAPVPAPAVDRWLLLVLAGLVATMAGVFQQRRAR